MVNRYKSSDTLVFCIKHKKKSRPSFGNVLDHFIKLTGWATGVFCAVVALKIYKPELEFYIEDNNNKYDCDQVRNDSIVSYYTIHAVNVGNYSLMKDDYVNDVELQVLNGSFSDCPSVSDSSPDYMNKQIDTLFFSRANTFVMPRLIFDAGDFINIKLPIKHKQDEDPKFVLHGKIRRQKEIIITDYNNHNYWKTKSKYRFFNIKIVNIILGIFTLFLITSWIVMGIMLITYKCKKT